MRKKKKSSKIFYFIFIGLVVLILGSYYFITSLKSNTRASENSFEALRACYNEKCNANDECLEFPSLTTRYSDLMSDFAKDLSKDCKTCFYKCLSNGGRGGGGGRAPRKQMFAAPKTTKSCTKRCVPIDSTNCITTCCTHTVDIYNSGTTSCVSKQD